MLRLPQPLWHLAGSQVAAAFEQLVPTDHPAHQVQRGFAVGVAAVVEREALGLRWLSAGLNALAANFSLVLAVVRALAHGVVPSGVACVETNRIVA